MFINQHPSYEANLGIVGSVELIMVELLTKNPPKSINPMGFIRIWGVLVRIFSLFIRALLEINLTLLIVIKFIV